jgi:hypothetical protein
MGRYITIRGKGVIQAIKKVFTIKRRLFARKE